MVYLLFSSITLQVLNMLMSRHEILHAPYVEDEHGRRQLTKKGKWLLVLISCTGILSIGINIKSIFDHQAESKVASDALLKQQNDIAKISGQLSQANEDAEKARKAAREQMDAFRAEEKVTQELHTQSRIEINNLQSKVIQANQQLESMNNNVVKLTKRVEELKADYGRLGESYGALLVENKELKEKLSVEPDPMPPPTEKMEPGDIATILSFPHALAFVMPGQMEDQVLCVVYSVRGKRFTYFLTSGSESKWERSASVDGSDTFALVRIDKTNRDADLTGFSVEAYDPSKQGTKEASLFFDGKADSKQQLSFSDGIPPVVKVSRLASKP